MYTLTMPQRLRKIASILLSPSSLSLIAWSFYPIIFSICSVDHLIYIYKGGAEANHIIIQSTSFVELFKQYGFIDFLFKVIMPNIMVFMVYNLSLIFSIYSYIVTKKKSRSNLNSNICKKNSEYYYEACHDSYDEITAIKIAGFMYGCFDLFSVCVYSDHGIEKNLCRGRVGIGYDDLILLLSAIIIEMFASFIMLIGIIGRIFVSRSIESPR